MVVARVLFASVALLFAACDGERMAIVTDGGPPMFPDLSAPDCPNDAPDSCPDGGGPSYSSTVSGLLDQYCVPCHKPGGVAFDHRLDNYSSVHAQRSSVLTQLYSCRMPPPDGGVPVPTETDRVTLLTWLICGAQQN